MSVLIVIVLVLGILGYLIYLARKNRILEKEIEEARKATYKQIEITKTYEKQQNKANEIKNRKEPVVKDEKNVEDAIASGNNAIASFNKLQDNKK